MKFTMTKIAAVAALALASSAAMAAPVATGGTFQMNVNEGFDYDPAGGGGPVNTDNSISGFVDMAAGTWGVSSAATFFGFNWTASNGTLITTAGSYALNVATGALTTEAPYAGANVNDGTIHFQVGANQMAGLIDFAWSSSSGINVVNVWDINSNGSLTAILAPGMEEAPFPGYNAHFNLTAAGLVPEASTYGMMLAGLGLVGFAVRRRKLMA
ncbi:MAG: PEP-CTERM sorting domain-containing protein [Thiobacillus sp.]|nr:PEP-CTERM sorting domain-containing protein [Thiobacillus sp.]